MCKMMKFVVNLEISCTYALFAAYLNRQCFSDLHLLSGTMPTLSSGDFALIILLSIGVLWCIVHQWLTLHYEAKIKQIARGANR